MMFIIQTETDSRQDVYRLKTGAGFTLLEVMLAVSIIAIVLVSAYKMHAQTISMNYIAKFQTTASLLAQRKMAEFENTSPDLLASDSGDFGDEFPDYSWYVTIEEVESAYLGNVAEDLKKVEVTVSLKSDEDFYKVSTYRLFRD